MKKIRNNRLFLTAIVVAIVGAVVFGVRSSKDDDSKKELVQANATTTMASVSPAQQVLLTWKIRGIPVAESYEFSETTDDNGKLGRPGEYVAKISWHDGRLDRDLDEELASVPNGGSMEIFTSKVDLDARKDFLTEGIAFLNRKEHWCVIDDLKLVRISERLNDKQAKEYCEK